MTLTQLVSSITLYLGATGVESEVMIKRFINESIIEFSRLRNWKHLFISDTITLDGSDSYLLDSTILSSRFQREVALVSSSITIGEYQKLEYKNYLQLSNQSYYWAIFGNKIYVTGDSGDLSFIYISQGDFTSFPLSIPADEVPATEFYYTVIEQMAVVRYLDFINDDEILGREEQNMQRKLALLKSSENRGQYHGKKHDVRRG